MSENEQKIMMWLRNMEGHLSSLERYQANGGNSTESINYYIDQIKNCNYNIQKLLKK